MIKKIIKMGTQLRTQDEKSKKRYTNKIDRIERYRKREGQID